MKNDIRVKKLKEGEVVPLKYDFHFVRVFGNPENMDIIEYFISDYYNIPIEEVVGNIQIVSRDLPQESKREKSKQVDLLLRLGNKKINIEISNTTSTGRKERDLVFLSRIHGGALEYRQSYKDVGFSWQIRLNGVKCNDGKLVRTYYLTSQDEDRKVFSDKFRIDDVDLEEAKHMVYNEDEKRVRWCKILTSSSRGEIVKELGDKLMDEKSRKKLLENIDRNSRDEEVIDIYEMYSTAKMERDDEMYEALEKNTKEVTEKVTNEVTEKVTNEVTEKVKREDAIETAKKMLLEGCKIDLISKITGLSKDEIVKLSN